MARLGFPSNHPWTPFERAIWSLSFVFFIIATVLLITGRSSSWAVLTGNLLVVALGIVRYRTETERANRSADDHDD